jgi:hypothetical protein
LAKNSQTQRISLLDNITLFSFQVNGEFKINEEREGIVSLKFGWPGTSNRLAGITYFFQASLSGVLN